MKKITYLPFQYTSNSITVLVNGKPRSIRKEDAIFQMVLKALKARQFNKVLDYLDRPNAIKHFMNGKVEVVNGVVTYNGEPINNLVSQRILEFMQLGLPYSPLIKFLRRVMQNPDARCREGLYKFLEDNSITLDMNGNIIGYKSLRPDYTDWWSGTVKNTVGKTIRFPEKITNADYGTACSGKGYHVGTYGYASTFYNNEPGQIICLVRCDPAKVISLPSDASEKKIRVIEYFVSAHLNKSNGALRGRLVNSKKMRRNEQQNKAQTRKVKRDTLGRFISLTSKEK